MDLVNMPTTSFTMRSTWFALSFRGRTFVVVFLNRYTYTMIFNLQQSAALILFVASLGGD